MLYYRAGDSTEIILIVPVYNKATVSRRNRYVRQVIWPSKTSMTTKLGTVFELYPQLTLAA